MGKVAVLGLGASIKEFIPDEFEFSIGVNDIWRYHHSEAVVVLDYPKVFIPDRLKIINECTPIDFYSQMVVWDTRPDFKKIDIISGYPEGAIDLSKGIYKSYCSPYVAVQIAYKYYGATQIHLFGADLTNHPNLNGDLCQRIKVHFQHLKNALQVNGCSLIVHGEGILTNML